MTSARLFILLILGTACHSPAGAQKKSVITPFFKDTTRGNGLGVPAGKEFDLRVPAQRDSLRALLGKERQLWRANRPRAYRFLLRVGGFCPGARGWLLMEVRGPQLRAWDPAGKPAPLVDWNTFSIDQFFDSLEGSLDRTGTVLVNFDPRWHFPTYVRSVALPGPDAWSIVEARALRPI